MTQIFLGSAEDDELKLKYGNHLPVGLNETAHPRNCLMVGAPGNQVPGEIKTVYQCMLKFGHDDYHLASVNGVPIIIKPILPTDRKPIVVYGDIVVQDRAELERALSMIRHDIETYSAEKTTTALNLVRAVTGHLD
jgi:hypothetical protein